MCCLDCLFGFYYQYLSRGLHHLCIHPCSSHHLVHISLITTYCSHCLIWCIFMLIYYLYNSLLGLPVLLRLFGNYFVKQIFAFFVNHTCIGVSLPVTSFKDFCNKVRKIFFTKKNKHNAELQRADPGTKVTG